MLKRKLEQQQQPLLAGHSGGHKSVMVPGVDTESVPTEIPAVVKARHEEGTVVTDLHLEDAWVNLHGDKRELELWGYTFPSLHCCIDGVHVPAVLHTVLLKYTITTPFDHKAIVV